MTKHRRAQVVVTIALAVATAAHFVCVVCAPALEPLAPVAGLAASLVWIWIE